jgi:hypothetical protein
MENMNKYVFGKLFAQPSFIEGMARTLDIGNTLQKYNEASTETEADIEAMKNDWRAIGDDIRAAISGYERTPFTKVV